MDTLSLNQLAELLYRLYGRRNRHFLPDFHCRIDFLEMAVRDLQNAVRKEFGNDILSVALARIVARIFCLSDFLGRPNLGAAMSIKYPETGCAYCHGTPCICIKRRPDAILGSSEASQLEWSLSDWQQHLDTLYGEMNCRSGVAETVLHLYEECVEVTSQARQALTGEHTATEIERQYELEIADLIAWTCAVANLFYINLEDAVMQRFGNGCKTCNQNPCVCGPFNMTQVDWSTYQ